MNVFSRSGMRAWLGIALTLAACASFVARAADPPDSTAPASARATAATTAIGRFSVQYLCPRGPAQGASGARYAAQRHWITDRYGRSTRVEIPPDVAASWGGLGELGGKWVRVHGRMLGSGSIAVTAVSIVPRSALLGPRPDPDVVAAVPREAFEVRRLTRAPGAEARPFLNLLVRFADTAATIPHPVSWYQQLFSGTRPGLNHCFPEESYGHVSVLGSAVVGWIDVPQPHTNFLDPTGQWDGQKIVDAVVPLIENSVDFGAFWGMNVFPNTTEGPYSYGGGAFHVQTHGQDLWIPGTLEQPWADQWVLVHEMGHSFGFDHSGIPSNEYLSEWDPMGNGGRNYDNSDPVLGDVAVHYNAYHKSLAGWIGRGAIFEALPGTDTTLRLERIGVPANANAYLMARIYIGGAARKYYTVEARRFAGYDTATGIPGEAVVIHDVDRARGPCQSMVVTDDGSADINGPHAMWLPGETFSDPAHGITVFVQSSDASGYLVRLQVSASQPTPGVVYSTQDSGPGSLREAIYFANDHPGTTIQFAIPTSDPNYQGGVFTIPLGGQLPVVTADATVIDGSTQTEFSGNTNPSGPEVYLDGTNAGDWSSGLVVRTSQCVIANLGIGRFRSSGIALSGAGTTQNTVAGTYLGTDAMGTAGAGNGWAGVLVDNGAHENTIGGSSAGAANVVAANGGDGIRINDTGTRDNRVVGNYVGTDRTGSAALPNGYSGIAVVSGATGTRIGGTASGERNLVSGSGSAGIYIGDAGTSGTTVQGNWIGPNAAGTAAVPNGWSGIVLAGGTTGNVIGGTSAPARNIISGNSYDGVTIADAGTTGNQVIGNYIGTDPAGTASLGVQGTGVAIYGGAHHNQVGGAETGAGNVLSGCGGNGVYIGGAGTNGNSVLGNRIGTDPTGTSAVGNGWYGVWIQGGAQANVIGGTASGARNIISGNGHEGVIVGDTGTSANLVQCNYIGTSVAGSAALPNGGRGVMVCNGATSNVIGGSAAAGNVISGNGVHGVAMYDSGTAGNRVEGNLVGTDAAGEAAVPNGSFGFDIAWGAHGNRIGGLAAESRNVISGNQDTGVNFYATGTSGNLVYGNLIGVSLSGAALPNHGAGVNIAGGASGNVIGVTEPGGGNRIASNVHDGVSVWDGGTDGNLVRGNAISGNGGLGINLHGGTEDGYGVALNDIGDSDGGPNRQQNFPVITQARVGAAATTVSGTLNSTPNTEFWLDFYASDIADPSGYGEGQAYIGSAGVTTGGSGNAAFAADLAGQVWGKCLTCTATNKATGDTSEFSAGVTTPQQTIIAVPAVTGPLGSSVSLSATLTSLGTPLAGRTLAFKVDGATAGSAAAGADGRATISFAIPLGFGAGAHTTTAEFAGDALYGASTGTGTLTALKLNVGFSLYAASGSPGQNVTLKSLMLSGGQPIVGRTVQFAVDGTPVGSAVSDAAGVVRSFTIPAGMAQGGHNVTVSFAGDGTYNAASRTSAALTVKAPKLNIGFSLYASSGAAGQTITLKSLMLSGGQPVLGKTVQFAVDGTPAGAGVSGSAGVSVPYTIPTGMASGPHNVTVSFAGDAAYNPASRTTAALTVTVPKLNVGFSLYAASGSPGQIVTLKSLMLSGGQPVIGRTVQFAVDGTPAGSGVSTSTGVALSYTIPASLAIGAHNVTVSFTGDSTYNPASRTSAALTVK